MVGWVVPKYNGWGNNLTIYTTMVDWVGPNCNVQRNNDECGWLIEYPIRRPPHGGFPSSIVLQPRGCHHGTIRLRNAPDEMLPTPTFLAPILFELWRCWPWKNDPGGCDIQPLYTVVRNYNDWRNPTAQWLVHEFLITMVEAVRTYNGWLSIFLQWCLRQSNCTMVDWVVPKYSVWGNP